MRVRFFLKQRCYFEGGEKERNIPRVNYEFQALRQEVLITLHSPLTPRDVFFVVRGMAYATDRMAPLSLVPMLDALARRACRNGAPILLRLAEAKCILVLHASLSLPLLSFSLSLPVSDYPYSHSDVTMNLSPLLSLSSVPRKTRTARM